VPRSGRHSVHRNKTIGRNRLTEPELGIVYILRRSLKEKKSLIIDNWGAMEGAAGTDGRRARGGKGKSREKKLRRIEDKRRRKEGLL